MGHAEHAEGIEAQRCEHLARNEEPDGHHRPEAWKQEDGGSNVDRGRDASDGVPPGHIGKVAERGDRAGCSGNEQQQSSRDEDLYGGGGERAAGRL